MKRADPFSTRLPRHQIMHVQRSYHVALVKSEVPRFKIVLFGWSQSIRRTELYTWIRFYRMFQKRSMWCVLI